MNILIISYLFSSFHSFSSFLSAYCLNSRHAAYIGEKVSDVKKNEKMKEINERNEWKKIKEMKKTIMSKIALLILIYNLSLESDFWLTQACVWLFVPVDDWEKW